MKQSKVFLGGTCADTTWRDELIYIIQIPYFNPVVVDWTEDCQEEERIEKEEECNVHLYVITSAMQGVFSIAEVIASAKTANKITILHIIPEGFDDKQLKSLDAVADMTIREGGIAYIDSDIRRTARILNNCFIQDTQ